MSRQRNVVVGHRARAALHLAFVIAVFLTSTALAITPAAAVTPGAENVKSFWWDEGGYSLEYRDSVVPGTCPNGCRYTLNLYGYIDTGRSEPQRQVLAEGSVSAGDSLDFTMSGAISMPGPLVRVSVSLDLVGENELGGLNSFGSGGSWTPVRRYMVSGVADRDLRQAVGGYIYASADPCVRFRSLPSPSPDAYSLCVPRYQALMQAGRTSEERLSDAPLYAFALAVRNAVGFAPFQEWVRDLIRRPYGMAPVTWSSPTPDDGEKVTARLGRTATFQLRASDPDGELVTISDLGLPLGLTCTDSHDGIVAVRDCAWSPSVGGFHQVTFDATDTSGSSAGQRTYRVGSGTYVALGDSYSSGEAVGNYDAGTDTYTNGCHRSPGAYPRLVDDDASVPAGVRLVACSGSTSPDLFTGPNHNFVGEATPQANALNEDTELVTLTMGGNDSGFSAILQECMFGWELLPLNNCSGDDEKADNPVNAAFDALAGPSGRADIVSYDEQFRRIRELAPNARVAVLGYPRFFRTGGTTFFTCSNVSSTDQNWVNSKVDELNRIIEAKAKAHGFVYVDYAVPGTGTDRFEGHRLCEVGGGEEREWFKDIQLGPQRIRQESFHPDADGHRAMAAAVLDALRVAQGKVFTLSPGESAVESVTVPPGQQRLSITTQWPGSDFVLSAISPSGRKYTRGAVPADVEHAVGPTFERLAIPQPEPGEWKVVVFAADVKEHGEDVRLTSYVEQRPNRRPVAALKYRQNGSTVEVDGTDSTDPDGQLVDYLIDWGDGSVTRDPSGRHTYKQAGRYDVSMRVTDNDGSVDFDSVGGFNVTMYRFGGFSKPLKPEPYMNSARAGSTLPVKWTLFRSDGAPVTAPTSFVNVQVQQVDCVAGSRIGQATAARSPSGLQSPSAGSWQYDVATSKQWAGSCRTLTVMLDDGITEGRSVRVRF